MLRTTIIQTIVLLLVFTFANATYLSFFRNIVMKYDVKSTVFERIGLFNVTLPTAYKNALLNPSQVVDESKKLVYGSMGSVPTWADHRVYSVLYSYDLNTKTTKTSPRVFGYNIGSLILDNGRLYGLNLNYGAVLMEYDPVTLDEKQLVANFTHVVSGLIPGGYYLPEQRTFSFLASGVSLMVTINMAIIPKVVTKPNEVDIVIKVIDFHHPFFQFAVDPSIKTDDGAPVIVSEFQRYIYQFSHATGEIIRQEKVIPDKLANVDDLNPIVVNPVTHEIIIDVPILHTGYNYFYILDAKTLKVKSDSVSKDPDWVYGHTSLLYVRDD